MPLEIPPALVGKAVSAVTDLGFRMFEGWITNIQFNKPASPQDDPKPCTVCLIHQHVVLARGYIEGLRTRLNPDGSVPAGLGGTIKQAQDHLKEAMMEIPSVVGAHPSIDTACQKLTELLPDCVARLEYIKGLDEWDIVLSKLKMAEDVAYAIPEALYRREPAQTPGSKDTIVVLKADEKELLDLLTKVRKNEISEEEAKVGLATFLTSGE